MWWATYVKKKPENGLCILPRTNSYSSFVFLAKILYTTRIFMVNNHYKCKSSRLKNYYYFYYHFYSTTTLLLSLGKPYPANKALLMQHSGYFRTVLSPSMTSLVLPTVPSEVFGLLWTSMASNSVKIQNFPSNWYTTIIYLYITKFSWKSGIIQNTKSISRVFFLSFSRL